MSDNIILKKFDNKENDSLKVTIPDNIAIKNKRLTCGSDMLEGFVPPYEATVIELLKDKYDIVGKTNLDEFNIYSILEEPIFGNNDEFKNASFSSSLSVKNEISDISFQLDTGGESRIFSSYLGLYGYKPTYGSISRYGIAPVSNTFDQLGIIGKDINNIKNISKDLFKKDDKDLNTIENNSLDEEVEEIKFGIIKDIEKYVKSESIKKSYNNFLKNLKENYEIIELEFLDLIDTLRTFIILSSVELSTNMSMYDGLVYGHRADDYSQISDMYEKSRREGFSLDTISRIILGTYLVSEENNEEIYNVSIKNRSVIKNELSKLFNEVDVLITPSTPFDIDEFLEKEELMDIFYNEIFTSLGNLGEIPGMTLPIDENIGIQLLSDKCKDNYLFESVEILGEMK